MSKSAKLMSLREIAHIRSGHNFRQAIDELFEGGDAHVVQINDARAAWEQTNSSSLEVHQLPRIDWQGSTKSFVESGSVLLPARGSKGGYFRASYLAGDSQSPLPVVVSSQFLIITPYREVLSEFLCWSLNQPKIQHWISEGPGSQGSNIALVNAEELEKLELVIPDFKIQKKILELDRLWVKKQQLFQDLLKNHETMLQYIYQHLLEVNTDE